MAKIEKSFLDDGFKVTYSDGVVERFHKNMLDDNYKGDKGSEIRGNWSGDGFTVNKFDGTKENFHYRNSSEFLAGDKGTRIKEGFWGDYYVSENPYEGFRIPTISEARKAKYQETPIRAYTIDKSSETTLDGLKSDFQDIIEASGLDMHISDVTVNGNPAIALVSNTNTSYMPLCSYFTTEDRQYMIASTVSGKGQQTNAADLSKLYYKAASPWGKLQIKASAGGAMANYFGYSVRAGGAIGGIGALTGFAIRGGFKLAAKGIKVLLRDNDAYQKEMDFYSQAAGVIDYAVGYNDSYGIQSKIKERAEAGLPVAQYQMGIAHIYGIGVESNEDMAINWFDHAAERGELRSQNIIAGEYLYNTDKEYSREQKEKGIEYLYNLASFGEDWAGQLIIDIYGRGTVKGIDLDYDEAIRIAKIYSEYDGLYSAEFLAPIYDTTVPAYDSSLNRYKDDTLAFQEYRVIAEYGEEENRKEAALRIAAMAKEGRGTEKNSVEALNYYRIAADCGNMPAKAVLLNAYTYGEDTERSKTEAEKYANEIIRSGQEDFVPEAYYSFFTFADEEKRYGDSMKHARQYIACENTDAEKKAQLEKYLIDMEAKIASMSDAERREFLKEPRKLSMNSKVLKWILLAAAVVVAGIIALIIFNNGNNDETIDYEDDGYSNKVVEKADTSDTINISDEARPALEAYNALLSDYSFDRNGFDTEGAGETMEEIWYTENCNFNIAYIDDDEVPELIVFNGQDSDHASGWAHIYTFDNGEIKSLERITSPDGANDAVGEEEGYYESSGYYMDFAMWQGYGSLILKKIGDVSGDEGIAVNYEPDEDYNTQVVGYSIGNEECSEEEYNQAIKDAVGDAEFIPYVFFGNTSENRETILGTAEGSNNSAESSSEITIGSEDEAVEYIKQLTNFKEGDSGDFENVGIGSTGFEDGLYKVRIYNDLGDHTSTLGWYGVTEEGYVYNVLSEEWIINESGEVGSW